MAELLKQAASAGGATKHRRRKPFDMQWRYVIGIPHDLLFNIAVKEKPFSFFHLLR